MVSIFCRRELENRGGLRSNQECITEIRSKKSLYLISPGLIAFPCKERHSARIVPVVPDGPRRVTYSNIKFRTAPPVLQRHGCGGDIVHDLSGNHIKAWLSLYKELVMLACRICTCSKFSLYASLGLANFLLMLQVGERVLTSPVLLLVETPLKWHSTFVVRGLPSSDLCSRLSPKRTLKKSKGPILHSTNRSTKQ